MNGENKTAMKDHPTVRKHRESSAGYQAQRAPRILDAAWLRQLCLECGADDVGFVEIGRPNLDDQRDDILKVFPGSRTLISSVCRINLGPIRSPARSVTNNYREFMGGFHDWVGTVADSHNELDYRRKVDDGETASLWQSLAFGPNYKAA